jgi:PBP1b-binding outer membrane lipoprotein LpoB
MKLIAIILCAVALTGCATNSEYAAYADAHKAQAAAQTARFQALADIAKQGDTTAKVAAVMSLQMGGGQQNAQINAPKNWADYAMQWTGLLLPTVGQIYTVNKQTSLGMRQSDNATALGISTNNAFVGMASQIQAPAANVTTIGGNGVIGSGSYSIGANSGSNSGNSGRIAGGGITDNTSVPTVVPTTTTTTTSTLSCTTGPC